MSSNYESLPIELDEFLRNSELFNVMNFKLQEVSYVTTYGKAGPCFEYTYIRRKISLEVCYFPPFDDLPVRVVCHIIDLLNDREFDLNALWTRIDPENAPLFLGFSNESNGLTRKIDVFQNELVGVFGLRVFQEILDGKSWPDITFSFD